MKGAIHSPQDALHRPEINTQTNKRPGNTTKKKTCLLTFPGGCGSTRTPRPRYTAACTPPARWQRSPPESDDRGRSSSRWGAPRTKPAPTRALIRVNCGRSPLRMVRKRTGLTTDPKRSFESCENCVLQSTSDEMRGIFSFQHRPTHRCGVRRRGRGGGLG